MIQGINQTPINPALKRIESPNWTDFFFHQTLSVP